MNTLQQIEQVESMAAAYDISVSIGAYCAYCPQSNRIEMCYSQVKEIATKIGTDAKESFLFGLLHEFGHSQHSYSYAKEYNTNPLLAEEAAWDIAESVYKKLWGNPPASFYVFRNYVLGGYYAKVPHLVTWG